MMSFATTWLVDALRDIERQAGVRRTL